MTDIDKLSRRYIAQSSLITFVIGTIGLAVMHLCPQFGVALPLVVSVAFSLVFALADGLFWRMAAKKGADALTTFYTAVSGFRMLAALGAMFIYYVVNGREAMMVFFLVFMVFYVALLVHHSLYFSKVANHS